MGGSDGGQTLPWTVVSAGQPNVYDLFRTAEGLLEDGMSHAAVELAEAAVRASPESASLLELLGRARYAARDHMGAVEAFERLEALEPSNAYAHFGLGRALERIGQLVDARAHHRLAAALSDRTVYARHLRRVEARIEDAA